MSASCQVGGSLRRILGWSLVAAALAAALWSRRLDWGMAPIVWVPALAVAAVGWGLKTTRRLELSGARLRVRAQGLLGRSHELTLDDGAELELLPTAGLRAVVLHQGGRQLPLATWVTATRAARIASWLETTLGRELPRRAVEAHRLDV